MACCDGSSDESDGDGIDGDGIDGGGTEGGSSVVGGGGAGDGSDRATRRLATHDERTRGNDSGSREVAVESIFCGIEMEDMVPPLPEDITAFTAGERLLKNAFLAVFWGLLG